MGSAGWSAGLSYDLINQNQSRVGTQDISLSAADQILNGGLNQTLNPAGNEVERQTLTRTTTLNLDYNSPEWGVSVQVPFLERYHTTYQAGYGIGNPAATGAGTMNTSQLNTLGDARIFFRYALSVEGGYGVMAGVKLPTGSTNGNFVSGTGLDASLQNGTGSTDVIFGGYATGLLGPLGWFSQGLWQHAVASQINPNAFPGPGTYRPGDAYSVNLGVRYPGLSDSFVPLLQVNATHRNTDFGSATEADGTPQSGGNLVYLAPGISATFGDGFRAYAYVQIPIVQNVNGVQLVAKEIFSFGIRKSF
jgi:hypothetical protein